MNLVKNKRLISINAVGDILLADGFFDLGYGMGTQIKKNGYNYPFDKVSHILKNADILIGNLESVISAKTLKKGIRGKEFIASPQSVRGLKETGFDILSVANNHIMQHGEHAFEETLHHLTREGIKPVGYISPGEKIQEMVKIEHDSVCIGLLSYSLAKDESTEEKRYPYFYKEEDEIIEQIDHYRNECDLLIILLHWGIEYVPFPSKVQIDVAHKLIDNGVDIILGHHPHVLQGLEFYKGKTIAYSLGNFVFNKPYERCNYTAILNINININKHGIQTANFIPIMINKKGKPQVPDAKQEDEIQNIINENKKLLQKNPLSYSRYKTISEYRLKDVRKSQKKAFMNNFYKINPYHILVMILEFLMRRFKENFNRISRN